MGTVFRVDGPRLTPAPGTRLITAADAALLVDAQKLLDTAREKAAALESEARELCQKLKEEAFQEGLAQGRMEQSEKIMETVSSTVEYLENVEQSLVGVVMRSIRKVLGEMPEDERIVRIVRQALGSVRDQQRVVLRVAPDDENSLRQALSAMMATTPGRSSFLELVADGRLPRGACLLESELGVVDASLEVQLKALENAFTNKIQR